MLFAIAADHLDVHELRALSLCNAFPLSPCKFDRIAGVSHDIQANSKVISGNPIGESVSLALNLKITQVSQGLFDGIDSQVDGFQVGSQTLRESSLSGSRQTREYEKSWCKHR